MHPFQKKYMGEKKKCPRRGKKKHDNRAETKTISPPPPPPKLRLSNSLIIICKIRIVDRDDCIAADLTSHSKAISEA